ncbi:MAG: hypothetical protein PHV17_04780 [Candidatus Omnitrophica bacterium]|nr:hypothetical protein [Candidatus Omnitrophota bacterium]
MKVDYFKVGVIFFGLLIGLSSKAFSVFYPVSEIQDSEIVRVGFSYLSKNLVYVASVNSLYQSDDSGKTFQKKAVFKDEAVSDIAISKYDSDSVYISTERSVYLWKNRLDKVFSASDEETIYSVCANKGAIYVGSSQGLYKADSDLISWDKVKLFKSIDVYSLAGSDSGVLAATSNGVYFLPEQGGVKKIFNLRQNEEEENRVVAQTVNFDIADQDLFWLGTSKGVYYSVDSGGTWRKLSVSGIDSLSVKAIAQTPYEKDSIYLASDKGFFKVDFKKKVSRNLFEGLSSQNILWAVFSDQGKIYLATKRGLYTNDYFKRDNFTGALADLKADEPEINRIIDDALRYNEAHPEKIKFWRKQLKYRAFFPKFSIDYDKTVTYDSGIDRYCTGPYDWGVSLSWDIGDLIWNTYQDDVDTRSRLDTQLRIDILDDIIRVYHERLRLKQIILKKKLPEEELFAKQLRLSELTAVLDGYTGGSFSRQIKEFHERE